jgi:PAS domain S-box-containing protein
VLVVARAAVQETLRELEPFWLRLQAEVEDLARRRQRYADLFDFAPEACAMTDARGVIGEVNPAMAGLLGRSGPLLVRKPLLALVAAGRQRAFVERFLQGARDWQSALRTRNGPLEVHVAVRRMPTGLCWTMRREA